MRIFIPVLLGFLSIATIASFNVEAQSRKRLDISRSTKKTKLLDSIPVADATEERFGLDQAVDIFNTSTDTSLYDPLTINNLRQMQEEAGPIVNADDFDVDKTRRVAEKALAIQSGQTFSKLMRGSELRSTYRSIMEGVKEIQDTFRFSLREDSDGLTFTREDKGKKLVELSLEMSAKQGFDPQVRFGENVRFRYDYLEKRHMLEYGFRF